MRFVLDNGDSDREAIVMEADQVGAPLNGFATPIVTAATLRNFVERAAQNDLNSEFNWMTITEHSDGHDATLRIQRSSDDPDEADVFHSAGTDEATGAPMYELVGWTWMQV